MIQGNPQRLVASVSGRLTVLVVACWLGALPAVSAWADSAPSPEEKRPIARLDEGFAVEALIVGDWSGANADLEQLNRKLASGLVVLGVTRSAEFDPSDNQPGNPPASTRYLVLLGRRPGHARSTQEVVIAFDRGSGVVKLNESLGRAPARVKLVVPGIKRHAGACSFLLVLER